MSLWLIEDISEGESAVIGAASPVRMAVSQQGVGVSVEGIREVKTVIRGDCQLRCMVLGGGAIIGYTHVGGVVQRGEPLVIISIMSGGLYNERERGEIFSWRRVSGPLTKGFLSSSKSYCDGNHHHSQ